MKHVCVTLDEPTSLAFMNSYSGAKIIHHEDGFAFWHCTDLAQDNIDKIHGIGVPQEVKLVGMLLLNKPQQTTITPTTGVVDAIPL